MIIIIIVSLIVSFIVSKIVEKIKSCPSPNTYKFKKHHKPLSTCGPQAPSPKPTKTREKPYFKALLLIREK
jgi:hypothetical protein